MTNCEICGAIRNLDRHHVIPRRMGGSKNPAVHDESNLMTLCRSCHRNLHEGRWELVRSPEGIWVFDKHTGELVMRRLYNPEVDPPSLFDMLNVAEDSLSRLFEALPYLTDDQLKEAFAYASSFGKRSWLVQAAILYEAQQRSTYGDRTLEALGRGFEISQRQAQKYALVWKVFFAGDGREENVNIDVFSLDRPSWYIVAATETSDPEKWLAYAQDRKEEDSRYSVTAFRRDILQSRTVQTPLDAKHGTEPQGTSVQLPVLDQLTCPWIRLFCVRSGKPTPVEDCCECEFRKTKKCETKPTTMEA
ncbi:MAG: HNH endonuclease [Chloroflexi bacterium]|nr:HNH endonuclease [Chloroflexota bacterium]MCI0860066.1 HNH endonuclease [Chloroflexota bacterium]